MGVGGCRAVEGAFGVARGSTGHRGIPPGRGRMAAAGKGLAAPAPGGEAPKAGPRLRGELSSPLRCHRREGGGGRNLSEGIQLHLKKNRLN